MNIRVVLVEDDRKARNELKWLLETQGCTVVYGETGGDALELTADCEPDGLVVSWSACGSDPLRFIRIIHMSLPGLPVFLTVDPSDRVDRKEAAGAGVSRIFTKPLDKDEVQFFFARILGAACGL